MVHLPLAGPAAVTTCLFVPLALLERRMQRAGGAGIVAFELAGPARSELILKRWGEDGRRAAHASLILDFPYLVAYTALNVGITARAAGGYAAAGAGMLARLGPVVAAAQVAAGACDAVENTALLGVLRRGGDERLAAVAAHAARAKFAALIAGWLYDAGGLLCGRVTRRTGPMAASAAPRRRRRPCRSRRWTP